MIPEIIYEDNHLLVVNKPAAMLTQGDRSGAPSLLEELKAFIKRRDDKPGNVFLGLVHRLDKPVSGVIVFAKTSKAARRLAQEIRGRRMLKCYAAVTAADAASIAASAGWWTLDHHVLRSGDRTLVLDRPGENTKPARLHLKTIYTGESRAYHLVRLVTGRKHQIRAQLARVGLPLAGDRKYGSAEPWSGPGIGLHALMVRISHPVRPESVAFRRLPDVSFYDGLEAQEIRRIKTLLELEAVPAEIVPQVYTK